MGYFFRHMSFNQPILLTQTGFNHLQSELADLVNNRRPAVVTRLANARSQGDLSENSDYISAREELSFLDGRIEELEDVIRLAKITAPANSQQIDFGHSVTVQIGNNQVTFEIVGEWEADPSEKKISNSSPLGKALIGKKIGDKIEVDAPAGKVVYTVLSIS
jgi:transcription elongation factor GreA